MAHEIETIAYANETPWHGLGVNVSPDVSVDDMLVAAGLNWTVDRCAVKATLPNGDDIKVGNKFAMVRSSDNKVLTMAGPEWTPLQNADAIGFMRDYVEAGGAKLETAGSLRGGQVVWGLAKMTASFEVSKGDRVNGYLLITSPHQVGQAIKIRTTTIRVVCANTMALGDRHSEIHYRQDHRSDFDFEAAKHAVGAAVEHLRLAEIRAKTIKKLKITMEDAVNKVFVPVFAPELADSGLSLAELIDGVNSNKRIAELVHATQNGVGADEGTGWGVLNGVTYWADHLAGNGAASRLNRAWLGDTGNAKLEVERILVNLAA